MVASDKHESLSAVLLHAHVPRVSQMGIAESLGIRVRLHNIT